MGGAISIPDRLTKLGDFPASHGTPGQLLRENGTGNGLEFFTQADVPIFAPSIEDYGAKCDGNCVWDASMTSGSNVLTSASGPFVAEDVGKAMCLSGAGAAGADFYTSITGYISPTQVTTYGNASTTVSNTVLSWGTDDTAAINAGLADVRSNLYPYLLVPFKRVYTVGQIDMVTNPGWLKGMAAGPCTRGGNPAMTTMHPTLLITNNVTPFIKIKGTTGSGLSELYFFYPHQDARATTPRVYPATISWEGGHILAMKNINAAYCYDFLTCLNSTLYLGTAFIENIWISVCHVAFDMDKVTDILFFHNIEIHNLWGDSAWGHNPYAFWPPNFTGLVQWARNNTSSWHFKFGRADQVIMSNVFCFLMYGGFWLKQSATEGRASYGNATNVHVDNAKIAIKADMTHESGWTFGPLHFPNSGGALYCCTVANGARVKILGGGIVTSVITNPFIDNTPNGGGLVVRDVAGYNPVTATATPAVPASGVARYNNYPVNVRVFVTGGTVTDIAISGISTGMTSGSFELYPGESMTITYSSAPTWKWMGL